MPVGIHDVIMNMPIEIVEVAWTSEAAGLVLVASHIESRQNFVLLPAKSPFVSSSLFSMTDDY
jgi:hypothetical protein